MTQAALINLHPNEYSRELHYYSFAFNLHRCAGSCDPNETEDINLHVFNAIAGINESRTLSKNISCKFECKFDGSLNQKWNNNESL